MIEERRKHIRFPIMHNVGEPIELEVQLNHKKISLPGFIMDLSAGGMGVLILGKSVPELPRGATFVLDLKLPKLSSHNVEGKIVRISKAKKNQPQQAMGEWFLGLMFTKISSDLAEKINDMAEDWSICETKIQLRLQDICFRECSYWDLCEKSVKLTAKQSC